MILPLLLIQLTTVALPSNPVFASSYELTFPHVTYEKVAVTGKSTVETDFAIPRYDRINRS